MSSGLHPGSWNSLSPVRLLKIELAGSLLGRATWRFLFPNTNGSSAIWQVSGLLEQEPGMILRQWKEIIRNARAGFGGRRGRFQGGPPAASEKAGRGSRGGIFSVTLAVRGI